MKNITITLSKDEWDIIHDAVRQVADRKLGFLKNHPEGDGCEWYKNMKRTARVVDNLADRLLSQIVMASIPKVLTHDQKMEMQAGEVEDA